MSGFNKRGLVLLAVVFFIAIYFIRIREDMVDFQVNLRAGGRLLQGETLYQTDDGHFMFKYLPSSALLYAPLALVPLEAAKAIWYAASVLCAIAVFVSAKRLVSGRVVRPWWMLALPPVVLAKFCLRELKLGQINLLVALVLIGMVWWLVEERGPGRDLRAGAMWGLATALKPYGFIFFPYFVVTRNWMALAGGLAILMLAVLVPSIFYGLEANLEVHREWFVTLTDSTPAQLGVADNVSIAGAVTKWFGDSTLVGPMALTVLLALGALVLAVMVRGRSLERAPILECALLMTLIPLVSPLGWDYQLLTSALAVTLLAHRWLDLSVPARWILGIDFAVIALSIYDVIGRAAYRAFMSWSVLTVCFLVVVVYLARLRWSRLA